MDINRPLDNNSRGTTDTSQQANPTHEWNARYQQHLEPEAALFSVEDEYVHPPYGHASTHGFQGKKNRGRPHVNDDVTKMMRLENMWQLM